MVPEGEQRASLSDWGVYIAGVASVLIWILKMLADKSKGVQKSLHRDRDGAMPQSVCPAVVDQSVRAQPMVRVSHSSPIDWRRF